MIDIKHISLLVDDYDKAIAYYTTTLQFVVIEDTDMGNGKRWVTIAPHTQSFTTIVLMKANDAQLAYIGNQAGGKVFLFLHTDDIDGYYQVLLQKQVTIIAPPVKKPHGTVAIFEDIYGNKWDLIQPR